MPYRIDFTAHIYRRQARFKQALALVFLLGLLGVAVAVNRVYREWSRPTLAQQMTAYHNFSQRLDTLYLVWSSTEAAFNAIVPWYELLWSESITNVIPVLLQSPRQLPMDLRPVRAELRTGGDCVLYYTLALREENKRDQRSFALESLEKLFGRWSPQITFPEGDLGALRQLDFTVRFALAGAKYRAVPPPPASLKQAVENMRTRRALISNHKVGDPEVAFGSLMQTAVERSLMLIKDEPAPVTGETWREWSQRVMDPLALLSQLEATLQRLGAPVPPEITRAREAWMQVGDQRWPWKRARALDNEELRSEIEQVKALFEANLPARATFEDQLDQVAVKRAPLLHGLVEEEVFDERAAERLLTDVFGVSPETPAEVRVDRRPVRDGLMFAFWDLRASGDLLASLWLNKCNELSFSTYGFLIEKIDVDLALEGDDNLRLGSLVIEGLFPVRSYKP